jgi:hypothetical protein
MSGWEIAGIAFGGLVALAIILFLWTMFGIPLVFFLMYIWDENRQEKEYSKKMKGFRGKTGLVEGSLYDKFLWYSGYRRDENDKDTISAMLARGKQRMGAWWWVLALATILFSFLLPAFFIWLFFHILFFNRASAFISRIYRAAVRRIKRGR